MSIREFGILLLAATGVSFMIVSSIGVLRLPDVYCRMHATAKTTSLGIACTLLAAGFYFGDWALLRMVVLLVLFFITSPIATTAIARAAHRTDYESELLLNYDELAAAEAQHEGDPGDAAEALGEALGDDPTKDLPPPGKDR